MTATDHDRFREHAVDYATLALALGQAVDYATQIIALGQTVAFATLVLALANGHLQQYLVEVLPFDQFRACVEADHPPRSRHYLCSPHADHLQ